MRLRKDFHGSKRPRPTPPSTNGRGRGVPWRRVAAARGSLMFGVEPRLLPRSPELPPLRSSLTVAASGCFPHGETALPSATSQFHPAHRDPLPIEPLFEVVGAWDPSGWS